MIHLAAPNWWVDSAAGREPYLARLLRVLDTDPASPRYFFDVITVRVSGNTAAVWSTIADVNAMVETAGIDPRPIWLEAGAQPGNAGGATAFTITSAQAVDFVVQATALGLAAGAERIAFAGLHHTPDEAFSPASVLHDIERLPAFDAYRSVIDTFSSTQWITRHAHPAAELIVLEGVDRDVYMMWAIKDEPVPVSITSNVENETATLITPHDQPAEIVSQMIDWPAAFRVTLPPAQRDTNGFLTIAGPPMIVVLDRAQEAAFVRVTYVQVNGERVRVR